MAINMQGSWTVSVKSKESDLPQRFIIAGADTGNGTYVGDPSTPPVAASGNNWSITTQNDPGTGFVDSGARITPPVNLAGQFQFDIESNDAFADEDFNDLILKCSRKECAELPKKLGEVCPPRQWVRDNICDTYILTYRYNVRVENQLVECTLRYKVERCTEDYVLGDLLNSVTLFPGEEVFMSTRSRHTTTRFTEDKSFSASQVSRSSDRLWMETYKTAATDFVSTEKATSKTSAHSSFSQTGASGSAGLDLGFVEIGGGVSHVSGEFDANSSAEFTNALHQHLETSFHQTNQVARDSSSISITQVNSHREATSERDDELKVATRRFKNINQCHTVTHYFYQIAKRQRVKITLLGRTCRALNRFANTAVNIKPLDLSLATNVVVTPQQPVTGVTVGAVALVAQPQFATLQRATLDQLNLQKLGIVSQTEFEADEKARIKAVNQANKLLATQPVEFTFEQVSIIPTEALYVESELGKCLLCEPYVVCKQKLDLERTRLENLKLCRETEILEKHKDYRCCDEETPAEE